MIGKVGVHGEEGVHQHAERAFQFSVGAGLGENELYSGFQAALDCGHSLITVDGMVSEPVNEELNDFFSSLC